MQRGESIIKNRKPLEEKEKEKEREESCSKEMVKGRAARERMPSERKERKGKKEEGGTR